MSCSTKPSLVLVALIFSLAACASDSTATPSVATTVVSAGGATYATVPATIASPNASLPSPVGVTAPVATSQQGSTHSLDDYDARPYVQRFLQAVLRGE